jgi:hypothetical protein
MPHKAWSAQRKRPYVHISPPRNEARQRGLMSRCAMNKAQLEAALTP